MALDRRFLGRIAAAALLGAATGGLAIALWPRTEPAPAAPQAPVPTPAAVETTEPAALPAPAQSALGPREAAENAVVAARARRESAVAELAAAEADVEQREREVAELEHFIADLKARGEDPAQHAEEGLALFHPALQGYQQTVTRIELAQAALRAADEDLAAAEQALAALGPAQE